MFKMIARYLIRSDDTEDPKVRTKYGTLCSLLSIFANLVCVIFKISIGLLVSSAAIIADGINNLTDAISNIATLIGFHMASKQPDRNHPYGHGRFEYLTGLLVGVLILCVGFSSLFEAVEKALHPGHMSFTWPAFIILIFTILVKLWMYSFNHYAGDLIKSDTLKTAATDSLNDVITTMGAVVSLIFSPLISQRLDGIIGIGVSLIVLYSAVGILREMTDNLLGKKPDPQLVKELREAMLSYPGIYGVHDMMIHDYGPGSRYMIAHLEVDSRDNIVEAHNLVDRIEKDITDKYHVFTTIHMDPIAINDPLTNQMSQMVLETVQALNKNASIHDFRIVKGDHPKMIFDVLLPSNVKKRDFESQLTKELHRTNPSYELVIHYDYSFV